MTTYIIYRPTFNLQLPTFQPSNLPTFPFLALALALGALGLSLSAWLIVAGLAAPVTAHTLALLPTTTGLGLSLACAYLEIRPCYATNWSGV